MRKTFMGVRLRRLREERGLTQAALAATLDLSTSYLSQLEKNQRPLTVPVLLKINAAFGVDVQLFSEDEERWITLGTVEPANVLFVVHTWLAREQEEFVRIISRCDS